MNSKISAVMKNSELKIPGRIRRQAATNPSAVYNILVKKQREVRQQINTLQAAIEMPAAKMQL